MANTNMKTLIARCICLLAIASLCLVAAGATRPAKRKKRSRPKDVMLKIGQDAPDFELYTLERVLAMKGKPAPKATTQPATQPAGGKVRLSSFRGKKPVYLIFASYT
jgi:hypothetical protein